MRHITETEKEISRDKTRWTPFVKIENERLAQESVARVRANPAAYGKSIVGLADICEFYAGKITHEELDRRLETA